ncbi:uncharacterized protein FFB20_05666 [Fusarium fujikuroi]|uniref:Uncharacterized protein n=1 Tax=Fusarium fujikuroi TaxID=5127 RepID=A0A5Q3G5I6_FUSFU|nr:hypothetical protein CEK27_011681 [Fusarium fujikuroi]QGI98595.1 hypothetical protein CEK26_011664 [Fusarium fujikuroi]SCN78142.1 uncharacterized protein FFB20_05666 [Fusarium fujikuroi]SCO13455.1 uncharacterized protein FFE2_12827 [Fusarium fujikuroi]SCV57685.1 uncharacterized protein FFFS_12837 [Fusarium fujikuroi]
MFPDLGHTLDKRWAAASRDVCRANFAKGITKIQAPLFNFLVDREVWEDYFTDIKSQAAHESLVKTPRWPFRITPEMMQDSHPSSREYAVYLNNSKREKRKTDTREARIPEISSNIVYSRESSFDVPQVPLPTLDPDTEVLSAGTLDSVEQSSSTAPSEIDAKTLMSSLPRNSSEQQRRQDLWKLADGESTFKPPIIDPFQMKLPKFAPLSSFVTGSDFEDLKIIATDFLPRGLTLKVEATTNDSKDADFDEVLTLGFAKGCGDKLYDRVELVRFWSYMTEWLSKVYHGESTTLCEHFLEAVMSPNRKLEPVSAKLDDLHSMHRRLCGNEE